MAVQRFTPANVREISAWANNCLSATVAEFLVDQLLKDKLSDETVAILGQLVSNYYLGDTAAPLSKDQLKELFLQPDIFPIDWQVMLGVLLRAHIEKADAANRSPATKLIHQDGQVDIRGFKFLAHLLKINVDFYLRGKETGDALVAGAPFPSSASMSALSFDSKDVEQLSHGGKSEPLVVLYDFSTDVTKASAKGHFGRLVADDAHLRTKLVDRDAIATNNAADGTGSYTRSIIPGKSVDVAQLKALVKAKIVTVCKAPLDVKEAAPKPVSPGKSSAPTPAPTHASAVAVSGGSMLGPVASRASDPLSGPKPPSTPPVTVNLPKKPLPVEYVESAYTPVVTKLVDKVVAETKAANFEKAYAAVVNDVKAVVVAPKDVDARIKADVRVKDADKMRVVNYFFSKTDEKYVSTDDQVRLDELYALDLHKKLNR